ncbi:MAG TPA: hypothetical protein P5150_02710 [Candidatus Ratteibacteria bacterium]|nr:hypothetical protein [Candidatus Ratteibacteria bacterium]
MTKQPYKEFLERFKTLISKNQHLIKITLSNIFTMRLIGNKTHGDLAEIALAEFINQYMYDYKSEHIGKQKFRAKEFEEDIKVINEINREEFLISIKAYGHGPLQLSTDKEFKMFPALQKVFGIESQIKGNDKILQILESEEFSGLNDLNILPLIYDEKNKKCNIMVFDLDKAKKEVEIINLESEGAGRKYPVFRFYNNKNEYICEVRYGGKDANALQRGFWTNTKNGENYFDSLTNGWIDYSDNEILVKLFGYALVSSQKGHEQAIKTLENDIEQLKKEEK